MMDWLDRLLDRVTMHRLLLYVLLGVAGVAEVLAWFGVLDYRPLTILASAGWFVAVCWLLNRFFAWVWQAPVSSMSSFLTGLILALIITPYTGRTEWEIFIWAPVLAIAGKYIVAINRQHIFNPAAFGVVMTALFLGQAATWWVGNTAMVWPVLIGGFLIIRKVRRFDVATGFLLAATAATLLSGFSSGVAPWEQMQKLLLASPILFFGSVMLVEPVTMPPRHGWRLAYGILIGLLLAPRLHIGSFYISPEYALLIGNLVLWALTRRGRFVLRLQAKRQLASGVLELVFTKPAIRFLPGQYLEWILPHARSDQRGDRRYFTIASSPTESELRLGVKFYPRPSSYKQALLELNVGETIVGLQLDGDFVLPADRKQPLVFLAGGIGVTPFRSMIKYLLDRHESRPVTLIYANQRKSDVVYYQVFDQAEAELGIRTVYTLGDEKNIPANWPGRRGLITPAMIKAEVPEWAASLFYVSGSQAMVAATQRMLRQMGISGKRIKTDYFPGLA